LIWLGKVEFRPFLLVTFFMLHMLQFSAKYFQALTGSPRGSMQHERDMPARSIATSRTLADTCDLHLLRYI
jgi:hypothetical protein